MDIQKVQIEHMELCATELEDIGMKRVVLRFKYAKLENETARDRI